MAKKIIVAGGGHGGIAAGALLAKEGFDVTVYERHKREEMGYDWDDAFDKYTFAAAGIPMPNEDQYHGGNSITFVSPYETSIIPIEPEENGTGITMDRKELYRHIISYAQEAGVKFRFETPIEAPLMAGDRVVGIRTPDGNEYADLIIDACGCESVIRKSLPECCGVQGEMNPFEKFYVYRALYRKTPGTEALHSYKVYLIPNGRMGIGWVVSRQEYADLLIGEFEPFTKEEAQEKIAFFKEHNPVLSDERISGGEITEIPVRHTLSVMVADGYAAIGDSAFMTIPLLGSGIGNSFIAAGILADVIKNDKTESYSAETLWDYQLRYYKEVGGGLAKLAAVKCLLPKLTAQQVDYMLENEILTANELTINSDTSPLSSDTPLIKRAIAVIKDKNLRALLLKLGSDMGRVTAVLAAIPSYYSRRKVTEWAKKFDDIFIVNN